MLTDPAMVRAFIEIEKAAAARDNPPSFEETWERLKWTPFPRQQRMIDAHRSGVYATLWGGAAGPGKSSGGRHLAIAFCRRYAGVRVGIFRRTYPELHRTHEMPIQMLPTDWGVYRHDPREFHFTNGSILELGSCERDQDLAKYQSAEYQGLIFDEATQFTWLMILFLNARVRSTRPDQPKFLLLLTNPGGESHAELKQTFVDPEEPETEFIADFGRNEGAPPAKFRAIFIPAKLTDNPALMENDPEYVAKLSALPENIRKAWMDGDWEIYEGQAFSQWRRDKHVVKPFEIPRDWPRWMGIDYGYTQKFVALWLTIDPDRNVYVYRELTATQLIDRDQALLIRKIEQEAQEPPLRFRAADPSVFSKQPNGVSIAQAWHNAGLRVIPANNDRKAGLARVHEHLNWTETTQPKLRIFNTCRYLIKSLPSLQYHKWKLEDIDTDGDDHGFDSLRYALQGGSGASRNMRLLDFEVVA